MLVLSRKVDESIVIDGKIRIKVIKTKGGGVRLGIDAPKDVPVCRGEIYNRNCWRQVESLSRSA